MSHEKAAEATRKLNATFQGIPLQIRYSPTWSGYFIGMPDETHIRQPGEFQRWHYLRDPGPKAYWSDHFSGDFYGTVEKAMEAVKMVAEPADPRLPAYDEIDQSDD